MPAIDLRSLQNALAGKIQLVDGEYDVRKLNGEQYQLLAAMDETNSIARLYGIASECTGIPEAELRKFPLELPKAIVALAGQGVEAVQALFPNVNGPEIDSSMSPGSSPPTS